MNIRNFLLWIALCGASGSIYCETDIFSDLETELAELSAGGIARGLALVPKIKERTDTLKVPVNQSDALYGTITLNQTGGYFPLNNLVADIDITGTNVTLDLGGRSIVGKITISGNAVVLKNGAIVVPPPTTDEDASQAALTIHGNAKNVVIKKCHIECYDSYITNTATYPSLAGRNGVKICGSVVNFYDTSIVPGASATTSTTHASDGGHAIVLAESANKVRILNNIMISGNGGSSTNGSGGNAGNGIHIIDTVNHVEVAHCTIFSTGSGGDGTTAGGNGGHGIRIESGAVDIGVHDCRIRNTGSGGSPGGIGGKAVFDEVTVSGAESILVSNFAHNIANSIKFDIAGGGTEKGVQSPNPPDGTVINPFANVYIS